MSLFCVIMLGKMYPSFKHCWQSVGDGQFQWGGGGSVWFCHLSCALSESVKRLERMEGGCGLCRCGNCDSFRLSEHRPRASLPAGGAVRGTTLWSLLAPQVWLQLQVYSVNPFPRGDRFKLLPSSRWEGELTQIWAGILSGGTDVWRVKVLKLLLLRICVLWHKVNPLLKEMTHNYKMLFGK